MNNKNSLEYYSKQRLIATTAIAVAATGIAAGLTIAVITKQRDQIVRYSIDLGNAAMEAGLASEAISNIGRSHGLTPLIW